MAEKFEVLPNHVGIIMDGNGRWAKKHNLDRSKGHIEGAKVFKKICEYACDIGIRNITFYAFSTENWIRPEDEIENIMHLFKDYLLEAISRKQENEEKGMKIQFIGDMNKIKPELRELIKIVETESNDKVRTNVYLAINYGGQQEILKSVKDIAQKVKEGKIDPDDITTNMIGDGCYTGNCPADLIIRPSGEFRLSNFLLWQSAYSEFIFSDILWPDYTVEDFNEALHIFEKRNRRFGGVDEVKK